MADKGTLSREIPLVPTESALLFIDVQNFCIHRDGAEFFDFTEDEIDSKFGYYFGQLESVAIPNMQRLQRAFRWRRRFIEFRPGGRIQTVLMAIADNHPHCIFGVDFDNICPADSIQRSL